MAGVSCLDSGRKELWRRLVGTVHGGVSHCVGSSTVVDLASLDPEGGSRSGEHEMGA